MSDTKMRLAVVSSVSVLFGVGVLFGWAASLAVFVVGMLLGLGVLLADTRLSGERERLASQRQALDAEWQELERTGRVRSVFLHARRAMQHEAQRWPDRDQDERTP